MTEEDKLIDDVLNNIIDINACDNTKKLLDYINA